MNGRIAIPRRVDSLVVLAAVLPLVVVVALAPLRPDAPRPGPTPPDSAPLSRLAVACPSPLGAPAEDVRVTRVPGVDGGPVRVRVKGEGPMERRDNVTADSGVTTVPDSRAATVVTGRGDAAPGLVAGRDEAGAVPECRGPWYDDWFVGAGATARQATVIELINPDPSPAVVNIEVHGRGGPVEDASWRGVTVAGHGVRSVALAERPVRGSVAAHVTVDQGRIRAVARHDYDALGRGVTSSDFLPAQPEPAVANLLLGVPTTGAQRSLFLVNPGDDEVRATVKVVTGDSTLLPSGSEEVVVQPRSQQRVPLADHLDVDAAEGALGLLVESTGPLLAGVRGLVDDDLLTVGPVTAHEVPMATVVPTGSKTLLAGGADDVGTLQVTATDQQGRTIWDGKRFEVAPDHAVEVDLPDRAVRLVVAGGNTAVAAAVRVEDATGPGMVRLRPTPVRADVPAVAPAP